MATAAVSNIFSNGSNADAVQVNSNFTSLVNFLNTEVITRDAAIAFTAIPSGPATNPTLDNQFTRKYYVDNLTPAGVISAYAGATAPTGYVVCDGSPLSRTNPLYTRLYAAIGTRYGNPDINNFNVPNLVGKFPYGHAASATVATAGAATVTLTIANLASHVHNISAYTHTAPAVTQPVVSAHADHNHAIYALPTTSAGGHDHDVYTSTIYAYTSGSPLSAVSYVTSSSSSPDPSTSSVSSHVHTLSGFTLDNATALTHTLSTNVGVTATASHAAKDTASAGSATPFDILPSYQSVLYIIKL
jgi:microcystin-dependent protein